MDEDNHTLDTKLEQQHETTSSPVSKHALPEDHDTPAAPVTPAKESAPADHPAADSNLDTDEVYEEGVPDIATSATGPPHEDEEIV